MSDIQEQIKLAHKRAEENDIKLLQEENKRLNNIIDGLEKWLIVKTNDNYKYTEYDEVLDKLNELKGDNK